MAENEVKINDIPVATSASFTDNDLFLIVDDGEARLLRRSTFQAWMLDNVQGEKGDTGATGLTGQNGADGKDGINGTILEENNPALLSQALIAFNDDREKLIKISEINKRLFKDRFDLDIFLNNMENWLSD